MKFFALVLFQTVVGEVDRDAASLLGLRSAVKKRAAQHEHENSSCQQDQFAPGHGGGCHEICPTENCCFCNGKGPAQVDPIIGLGDVGEGLEPFPPIARPTPASCQPMYQCPNKESTKVPKKNCDGQPLPRNLCPKGRSHKCYYVCSGTGPSTRPRKKKQCCRALSAKCLACSARQSVKKYCKKNPDTAGCPFPTERLTRYEMEVQSDCPAYDADAEPRCAVKVKDHNLTVYIAHERSYQKGDILECATQAAQLPSEDVIVQMKCGCKDCKSSAEEALLQTKTNESWGWPCCHIDLELGFRCCWCWDGGLRLCDAVTAAR